MKIEPIQYQIMYGQSWNLATQMISSRKLTELELKDSLIQEGIKKWQVWFFRNLIEEWKNLDADKRDKLEKNKAEESEL